MRDTGVLKTGRNGGFTLLELMISLSITALILVVVFGSFRVGVRAWEKGEAEVEARQRERIVMELIKRQLSSAVLREDTGNEELPYTFAMAGDDTSLSFISHVPLVAFHGYGMVFVRYAALPDDRGSGERLSFFEENIVLLEGDFDSEGLSGDDYFELLSGFYSIRFEYMKRPDEETVEGQWQDMWDPEDDEGYPQAVKLTLKREEASQPLTMIARLEPELNEN